MDRDIRILKQSHHRNGIGGEGFYVTLFEWPSVEDEGVFGTFVAITFEGYEGTEAERRETTRARTAVLNLGMLDDHNIEFANGNSWRGADHVGPSIVEAIAASDPDAFKNWDEED